MAVNKYYKDGVLHIVYDKDKTRFSKKGKNYD